MGANVKTFLRGMPSGVFVKSRSAGHGKKLIIQACRKPEATAPSGRLLEISHPSLLSKIKTYEIGL